MIALEIGMVVIAVAFLALAVVHKLTLAENFKLREDLAVAEVRLGSKVEEIERLHGEIAFQKKMRAHADEFLEQVQEWLLAEPEPPPKKPKGFYYLDPATFEVKWKQEAET
jgi:hypothetical protein